MLQNGEFKTILIADDEQGIRMYVAAVLDGHYNILVAESGEAALRQSREHRGHIHLLISDVRMPGMDGIELGAAVNLERPETRVMLMSGYCSGKLILKDDWYFLPKPFVPSQLLTLVRAALDSSFPVPAPDPDERQRHKQT